MLRRYPSRPQNRRPQVSGSRTPNLWLSTGVLCAGLLATTFALPGGSPNQIFYTAAIWVGLSLAVALGIELQAGFKAMLRTDVVMLLVLYLLTFLEFLFPQRTLAIYSDDAIKATNVVLIGFAGIAIGRLFIPMKRVHNSKISIHMSRNNIITMFMLVSFVAYFHIFYAVGFDLFEVIRQMQRPRFSQAWARGRLGGWSELLTEIGALIYLIPPLAGYIFARSRQFDGLFKLFVCLILGFTLFSGFAGGTRTTLGVYFITLIVSYFMFQERFTMRQALIIGFPALCITLVAMYYMLEFRRVGISGYSSAYEAEFADSVYVDHNLLTISRLMTVFPERHPYLGFELPYHALIRPVPRAIWSGKPEGLSLSIEEALGVGGYTLAATFVGEAYIAGGTFAVAIAGLFFGVVAAGWNRVGQDVRSNFKIILFASGLFCAAITMRSFMATTVAALPTIGLWFMGKFWLKQARRRRVIPRPVTYTSRR